MFFTLSGFLITFLMLKEKEKEKKLNVKNFYIRRILRIWPLYYLYIIISLATIYFYNIKIDNSSIYYYVFCAANIPYILDRSLPFLYHYWSLGVEEQFYLFFPIIARLANKRLFKISIGIILVYYILKVVFWVLYHQYNIPIPYLTLEVTRFQSVLIGVVGAIFYFYKNSLFFSISTHKLTQAISWLIIFLLAVNQFHIASIIDGELVSVISIFLIMGQITKKNNLINLENSLCNFIGKISFGIYVIHSILIYYFSKFIPPLNPNKMINYFLVYAIITGSTIMLAYLSYEFFEKRFLKLKLKYSTIKSGNSTP